MEILTFILVLVLLILFLINNSSLNKKIDDLVRDVSNLRQSIQKTEKSATKPKEFIQSKEEDFIPSKVGGLTLLSEPTPSIILEEKSKEEIKPGELISETPIKSIRLQEPTKPAKQPVKPKVALDIEKFIGENLISKIGIIILVLGIGYFVKYAIDQNWINEYGRVAIGMLTGGGLIALAYRMRKEYKTFSSLLTGGGFAVFYLTITIAFHEYHLFSQTAAFIILIIITIFSVILSLAYDKKELAIFSQLGGYAAPFMVSTGEGNYIVLFSYLLILNAGLISLAYYKRWHILNLIAFVFTLILFSSWLANTFIFKTDPPYLGALVFATLFYLVFFLVNILNNLKEHQPFKAIEISMILSNNLFYFLAGMVILNHFHEGAYKGLFTVLTGLYNFAWVFTLYKNRQIDKNLVYLLIGLVMSYVSLAIPIQLNGHSITLFWTAELVVLLWLSSVSGIRLLKIGHLIIAVLVLISLCMDWITVYSQTTEFLPVMLNRVFITGLVVIAGFGFSHFLLKNETEPYFVTSVISVKIYKSVLSVLLFTTVYLVLFLELQYQMNRYLYGFAFRQTVYGVFNFAYLYSVLWLVKKWDYKYVLKGLFYASVAMLFIYIIFYNTMTIQVRNAYFFMNSVTLANFCFHYLVYPFLIAIMILLYSVRNHLFSENGFVLKGFPWFMAFFCVVIASSELDNLVLLVSAPSNESTFHLLKMNHRVGYPILWGVIAFIAMLWGLRSKQKIFRIISLSLFSLILLKLFLIDVWNMNEGGRIASFIFLGIILLVVSFLYQKLKKFVLEGEKEENGG